MRMAGNRTSLAINLMTPAGLVEGHSLLRSMWPEQFAAAAQPAPVGLTGAV